MMAAFRGFPEEGMAFFRGLKKHNEREWFQPRKETYEQKVKAPMVELVAALNREMREFAPEYVNDPAKAIYRIYRDTRFSKDKTPYKTHIAAVFPRRGMEKHAGGGFYFSVAPDEIEIGGGVYMPPPPYLNAIRAQVAERHPEFRRILGAKAVKTLFGEMVGEQLSRPPKGYPADHPAADLLRYKQFLLFVTLEGKIATTPRLYKEVLARLKAMTPFVEFLNQAVAGTARPNLETL